MVTRSETITVTYIKTLCPYLNLNGISPYNYVHFLCQIILHPHVVVPDEDLNFNTSIG